MLGKVIINNQSVHAVRHEPLAHRCPSVGSQVLVGRRVRGWSGNDDRVLESALLLENTQRTGNVGILLSDRHIDRVDRPEIWIA